MRRLLLAPLLLVGLLAACDRPAPTAIEHTGRPLFKSDEGQGRGQFVTVLSRNLFVGTDVAKVLAAPPDQIPIYVWAAHQEVIGSRPAERMASIAAEIAAHRPEVVGLQEVTALYTQTPGDFLAGNPQQATAVQFEYLQLLLDALLQQGMDYEVASVAVNMDLEIPAFDPTTGTLYDVRIVNRDVILVRRGVENWNAQQGIFAAYVPVNLGMIAFPYLRSWTSVDVKVHGRELRFLNTHLEAYSPLITSSQANELLRIAGQSALPVVIAGDFNSPADAPADDPRGAAYRSIVAAGFTDVWLVTNPGDAGLTCCIANLLSPALDLRERIDLIFFGQGFRGAGSALLVGSDPAGRTPSGLWPSDHFGVVTQLRLP